MRLRDFFCEASCDLAGAAVGSGMAPMAVRTSLWMVGVVLSMDSGSMGFGDGDDGAGEAR